MLLDAGPLGMISHPRAATENTAAFEWFARLLENGVVIEIPEIADYEVRRKLLRAGKARSVRRLDELASGIGYRSLSTVAMREAASLWARARNEGNPTAPPEALDADVLLAAQASEAAGEAGSAVVATTDPRHLSRFVDAHYWQQIEP